jgi:hypothetical protein
MGVYLRSDGAVVDVYEFFALVARGMMMTGNKAADDATMNYVVLQDLRGKRDHIAHQLLSRNYMAMTPLDAYLSADALLVQGGYGPLLAKLKATIDPETGEIKMDPPLTSNADAIGMLRELLTTAQRQARVYHRALAKMVDDAGGGEQDIERLLAECATEIEQEASGHE